MWPPDASTGFFAIVLQLAVRLARGADQPPCFDLDNGATHAFKCAKPLVSNVFPGGGSRALNVRSHRVGLGFDALHPVLHQVADRYDPADLTVFDDRKVTDSPLSHERQG